MNLNNLKATGIELYKMIKKEILLKFKMYRLQFKNTLKYYRKEMDSLIKGWFRFNNLFKILKRK